MFPFASCCAGGVGAAKQSPMLSRRPARDETKRNETKMSYPSRTASRILKFAAEERAATWILFIRRRQGPAGEQVAATGSVCAGRNMEVSHKFTASAPTTRPSSRAIESNKWPPGRGPAERQTSGQMARAVRAGNRIDQLEDPEPRARPAGHGQQQVAPIRTLVAGCASCEPLQAPIPWPL